MTKDTSTLRLGPLPRTEFVKLAIAVPVDVKASLDRYADLHSQLHGEKVDALLDNVSSPANMSRWTSVRRYIESVADNPPSDHAVLERIRNEIK